MGLMPSNFSAVASLATTGVSADRLAWLGTATGRRVMSVHAVAATGTPSFRLYRTADVNTDNLTTAVFAVGLLGTNGQVNVPLPPGGVDCSGGVSIDHIATGTFDIVITYIDVT